MDCTKLTLVWYKVQNLEYFTKVKTIILFIHTNVKLYLPLKS